MVQSVNKCNEPQLIQQLKNLNIYQNMTLKCVPFILFLLIPSLIFAQKKQQKFNVQLFTINKNKAAELYMYDWVAWSTTDSIVKNYENEMAQLGREWFAIKNQQDQSWYAIYGKLDSIGYQAIIQFKIDSNETVERIQETPYKSEYLYYAKALQTADQVVHDRIIQTRISFNSYVIRNADKTFHVYFLPAIYNNNYAIYGAEHILKIDSLGEKVIKDESYIGKSLRGYHIEKDSEINLNYDDQEVPTIGSLFYIYSFNRYYDRILIICKDYATMLTKDTYTWVHIEITKNKKKKKKK